MDPGVTGKCIYPDPLRQRPLTRKDLKIAKARLRLFDVIMILEYLPHTAKLLCEVFGWSRCHVEYTHLHAHPRERIGNEKMYRRLIEKNRLGIELYEYAVELSLFQLKKYNLPIFKHTPLHNISSNGL